MNFHFSERIRRRLGNLLLLVLGMGVLATLWGTVVRVREGMAAGREDVRLVGEQIAQLLDQEAAVYLSSLKGMSYLADRFLRGQARGTENPVIRLAPVPTQNGYQSVFPPEFSQSGVLGRITGAGPVPALTDPVSGEMSMAVGLTPLMRAIKERSPAVAWVHYASERQFMFIFPKEGTEQFFFRPELLQRDYFARARPEVNPERAIFWSDPYEDAAGQGTLVTVTQPIDHAGKFVGSVSIDFKIKTLSGSLQNFPTGQTRMHLKTTSGKTLVQTSRPGDDTSTVAHDTIQVPLKNAPWVLELDVNPAEVLQIALHRQMWFFTASLSSVFVFVSLVLLVRNYRQVRDMAITDGLTGLFNRRHFETVAAHQFELAHRGQIVLGLGILDIDYFKKFNDHYGHQQGDVALKAVAQAVKNVLRRSTDQVFRVGGEEFAILLSLGAAGELAPLVQHVNLAVRDLQLPHAQHPLGHVTVSIGAVAISREHWMDPDAAYKAADDCLYEAKQSGRDRAVLGA